jgi:hypothetical protein
MQRLIIRKTDDGTVIGVHDSPRDYPYLRVQYPPDTDGIFTLAQYRVNTRPASKEDAQAFIAWYEAAHNERVQQLQRLSKYFNGGA